MSKTWIAILSLHFSHSQKTRSFTAVEFCFEEDMKNVKPGFELLESSFSLAP